MPDQTVIRVGTRGSRLARVQTGWVVRRLEALGARVVIVPILTRGDEGNPQPPRLGSDGVFVRELESALRESRIDAAVHSLKDLPTADSAGLSLACIPSRALPWDVFVGRTARTLAALPAGSVVGTSSIRRVAQVRLVRPDLRILPVRGNVDTRLRLLDKGRYDALILAGAGLERLGLAARIDEVLTPGPVAIDSVSSPAGEAATGFWPAIAQGALAALASFMAPLDDPLSRRAVTAERACLAALAGGCLAPIGAVARGRADGGLSLTACVLEERDSAVSRIVETGLALPAMGGAFLGLRIAERLRDRGADEMLARMRQRWEQSGQ
jgi:hydroxymethylbilane synthase